MKNKLNYIFAIVLIVSTVSSCRDDSKSPYPNLKQGTAPVFTPASDDTGLINYLNLHNGTKISFSVDKSGAAPVSDMDIILIYNNSETNKSDTVTYTTTSTFPSSFSLDIDHLLATFPPDVVTIDSLSIGDSFNITANVLLTDGTYLEGGFSPSLVSIQPVILTYNVGCPSNIPDGTYTASQGDEAEWFGGSTTKQVTITKVKGTANTYLISDVSAGGYAFCCKSFGYNVDQPAVITDVCNMITVSGDGSSQIKSSQGLAIGSWDESTKTLIVHYADAANNSGGSNADLFSTFVKN